MTTDLRSTALNKDVVYIMNTSGSWVPTATPKSSAFEKRLEKLRKRLPYQVECLKEGFSDDLWQAMEHRGLTQAQFARRAKMPRQYLTKVFRGGNCTIETMARLAFALKYRVHIHLAPDEAGCAWIHAIPQSAPRPREQFSKLWSELNYTPISKDKKELTCETVPFTP